MLRPFFLLATQRKSYPCPRVFKGGLFTHCSSLVTFLQCTPDSYVVNIDQLINISGLNSRETGSRLQLHYGSLFQGEIDMKLRLFVLMLLMLLPAGIIQAQTDLQAELDDYIASLAPADGPAVSARITIGDETWAAAGGLANIESGEPATPEDRFRIASMSKTWLAVTLMKLVEDGKLSLDDPVINWLPDRLIAPIANASEATVGQLVTMTSGIPEYLNDEFYARVFEDPQHAWTAEEVLPFAYDLPPSFEPGSSFEYVNTNYILLQLVIEAAAGKPMHEVMREVIFDPLALPDTYVQAFEDGAPTISAYEDFDGDGIDEDVSAVNDGAGLGDGALVSTTADSTRFYQAVFANTEILSEESVQQMIDLAESGDEYGAGLEVIETDYGQIIGHTGSVLGFSGAIFYAPDLDATVVILHGSQASDMPQIEALLAIAANAGGGADDEAVDDEDEEDE
jgi:D-alanyl-D-alanine carboxypeptidase